MKTNTVTAIEANENLSPETGSANDNGQPVVWEMTDDEKIDVIAVRILKKHRAAFEELAK